MRGLLRPGMGKNPSLRGTASEAVVPFYGKECEKRQAKSCISYLLML